MVGICTVSALHALALYREYRLLPFCGKIVLLRSSKHAWVRQKACTLSAFLPSTPKGVHTQSLPSF